MIYLEFKKVLSKDSVKKIYCFFLDLVMLNEQINLITNRRLPGWHFISYVCVTQVVFNPKNALSVIQDLQK